MKREGGKRREKGRRRRRRRREEHLGKQSLAYSQRNETDNQ